MKTTSKLLDNLLRNIKTQPYSFRIQILVFLYKAKQLEKLAHILFLNADTRVNDLDLNHAFLSFQVKRNKFFTCEVRYLSYKGADNCYATSTLCELKSIRL